MHGAYSPPRVYEPTFLVASSHDNNFTDRIPASTVSNQPYVSGVAVYVPFTLTVPGTIYEWWYLNGTLTTAHNFDVGIYRLDFTKVQSLGSTAGITTASAIANTTTWSDLDIAAGQYYMAFANDSVRNFFMSADAAAIYAAWGVMEQSGVSSTLPDPMVPVAYTRAFLPQFGFNMRTTTL